MTRARGYVFVLWGNRCDEAIAAIFVTELRQAGLRVKVVGLTRRQTAGIHGLVLVPDLTLEEALPLAGQSMCVIIPCNEPGIKRLKSDPRVSDFLKQAQTNRAWFVIQPETIDLSLLSSIGQRMTVYPSREALIRFVRELAGQIE